MMVLPLWALALLIGVTVAVPVAYVILTWDHELTNSYLVLPAPADLGTKEFQWRCYLSGLTRRGWRTRILRSPCPRLTLQCRFALLSTDFAKLTTALGFRRLELETIPAIFPQLATSGLFLQLVGNSNFPAALGGIRITALKICQLRPLDMRFRDEPVLDEAEDDDAGELHCLMVLTQKRFLDNAVEFCIQTDIFDRQGTVWQSFTTVAVPFKQKTLVAPLSESTAHLDPRLASLSYKKPKTDEFLCTPRNLDEFEEVNVTNLDGSRTNTKLTPLMWTVGRTWSALQQQNRLPELPLLASFVFDEKSVPLGQRLRCKSGTHEAPNGKEVVHVDVSVDQQTIVEGQLRTVGWVYQDEDPHDSSS